MIAYLVLRYASDTRGFRIGDINSVALRRSAGWATLKACEEGLDLTDLDTVTVEVQPTDSSHVEIRVAQGEQESMLPVTPWPEAPDIPYPAPGGNGRALLPRTLEAGVRPRSGGVARLDAAPLRDAAKDPARKARKASERSTKPVFAMESLPDANRHLPHRPAAPARRSSGTAGRAGRPIFGGSVSPITETQRP